MKRILVVEDDETISFGLTSVLTKNGYEVCCAASIEEGRELFSPLVSLVLLDWNLPDGTGADFCRFVKSRQDVPVIFLTVRDGERDIVQGLDMGADDYITKPFQLAVLLSRIRAVLRRSTGPDGQQVLACGGITVDKARTLASCSGQELALSAGEYRLLTVLLEHKNLTMTRTQLLDKLWDANGNFVNDNTLTVTMKRLREKLGNPDCIKTIRGIGYRMEEEHEQ
ncbi:MAG: response regulator transcription factor [Paenibacillaceae bacterium]|nr:response regulator transcription factor [Paenibacillaceae bacterium]